MLDTVGLITLFGNPADIANGILYTMRGKKTEAAISYASVIIFGDFSKLLKFKNTKNAKTLFINNVQNMSEQQVKNYLKNNTDNLIKSGDNLLDNVDDIFKRFDDHYDKHVIKQKEFGNIT